MTNWLIYSPFSKHSFWGKLTEQMNRTDATDDQQSYYLSINEAGAKTGMFMAHWNKVDSQFHLDLHAVDRNLIVIQPNSQTNNENPFQREINTEQIKQWLETYNWIGFGYIIAPKSTSRYEAMTNSVYYTRDSESNFVLLSTNQRVEEQAFQPVQTWFIVTKATADLNVIFCHPDVIVPSFGIEYQIDNNGDTYYTYQHEDFNYFDLVLKPKATGATIVDSTIYSTAEYIDLTWSAASHLSNNTKVNTISHAPTEIVTDLEYTLTANGIKIKNQKGLLTLKYNIPSMLCPSIIVDELGKIEKNYIILGN
jgi:hypothetical protein